MGFFDGVKGKLGFNDDSDWQDGQNQYSDDGYYDDSYNDEGGYYEDESLNMMTIRKMAVIR